jgi:ParB/RepB/Spo0J family partition protein
MTQVSFKQMIKEGTVRRADAMKVRYADLHVEDGFNLRMETPDFNTSVRVLADYIKEGGVFPPLEVRPRQAGGVYIVDGHRRRLALGIAIAEGAPIEWIDVRAFTGNDADRVARIITSAEGRPLSPLETAIGYKRLAAFGWSSDEIGRRVGRTRSYVDQLLMLANANSDVQNLVAAGTVSAANAVQVVREYGEDAGAILAAHVSKAKANGKARVTAATLRGATLPSRVVDRLVASVDALAESIPADIRTRLLAKQDSANTMVAVPASMLSDLLAAYGVAKTPRLGKSATVTSIQAAVAIPVSKAPGAALRSMAIA